MPARSEYIDRIELILRQVKDRALTIHDWKYFASHVATSLLAMSLEGVTARERARQAQLARMIKDPMGKAFTMALTDRGFRSRSFARTADQLIYLIDQFKPPAYLSFIKRLGLQILRDLGKDFSAISIPLLQAFIRHETQGLILPAEPHALHHHLAERQQEKVRVNLNYLGEAILGEEEAAHRLQIYLESLQHPQVECISVKISSLFSQINLLAWDDTLEELRQRLRKLYHAAIRHRFRRPDGTTKAKFITLDMEEHRDLVLTVTLFQQVLDEPAFHHLSAGIVLQSYLPESFVVQKILTQWALKRVEQGRAPIKIRLVKGANLAMETLESSLRGWPLTTYATKAEVDANYKRMVIFGCQLSNAKAVHLGIASHNLFDIAFAMLLRAQLNLEPYLEFEMLEGMAEHQRRALQKVSNAVLLYCPVAKRDEFHNAIAYLIRRLDENTGADNFLHHSFDMTPASKSWEEEAVRFLTSLDKILEVSSLPKRTQHRYQPPVPLLLDEPFRNEPDTDFSIPENRAWAFALLQDYQYRSHPEIPLMVGGEEVIVTTSAGQGIDPSEGTPLFSYRLADWNEVSQALEAATKAQSWWGESTVRRRTELLEKAAHALRQHRALLIGAMIANTGKTIPEADVEISEAIDFAEYYARSLVELHTLPDIRWQAKGIILVAPPWNFPLSIPAGGIFAALAGGNAVLFKPAPQAVLVGWELAKVLWQAGIPKEVLQFIPCPEDPVGCQLLRDKRLSAVLLTGASSTAKFFLQLRPDLDVMAETGGKNSLIITAMADRDLAIRDLVLSAFGHSGQKCSAASLAICEAEVYDDPNFFKQLKDAVASLPVGSAWDLKSRITPLICPPEGPLRKAIDRLEEGEKWLLEPKMDENNPHLLSPGIKIGVRRGSYSHKTELFGPILSVMRAHNLQEAIDIANDTPYGLTAGLHSLDEREHELWKSQIEAGNLYINRTITGAIVQRQPFGGCKESSFGPGAKAGGPNYVAQMMQTHRKSLPIELAELEERLQTFSQQMSALFGWQGEALVLWEASLGSYAHWWQLFKTPQDVSHIIGEDNLFYLVPRKKITLRLQEYNRPIDICRALAASLTCGCPLELSYTRILAEKTGLTPLLQAPQKGIVFQEEEEADFFTRIEKKEVTRIRLTSSPSKELLRQAATHAIYIASNPVHANGRLELLHYTREVSLSYAFHRYGNLSRIGRN